MTEGEKPTSLKDLDERLSAARNKRIGEWLYYDKKGNLTQKDTYKAGELIKSENMELN